jgi:hypothetical protein
MQGAPATQPTSIGTLTVRAVQKTAGGPAIKGDDVTVEIYDQDNMIKKIQAKLDENGVARVPDVPFGGTYGQFIRVNHASLEYTAQVNAGQEVAVNCYEATDQVPAWNIKMRHMIVQPIEGGVQVTDVLAVENPGDKAWIGRKEGDQRTTFAFAVPATATDVKLDGAFHECCVKVENGKLTNTMALWPGVNKYQVSYVLPVGKDGKAQIETTAPALTKNMIVMLPDDNTPASAEGLEGPSTVNMGSGNTRFFRGQDLKEGASIKIHVTSTPAAVKASVPAKSSSNAISASQTGKLIAGAGGLLIFLVGGSLMFLKAPKSAKRSK